MEQGAAPAAKQKSKSGGCFQVIGIATLCVLGLGVVGAIVSEGSSGPTNTAASSKPATAPGGSSPSGGFGAAGPVGDPVIWNYSVSADKMTDAKTRTACTTSTNRASLDWPYKPVTADLCLRQAPRTGLNVYVVLNGDGQIICHSFSDCALSVRFGSAPLSKFSASEAADNSSNIVFIDNASRFLEGVRRADKTLIELEFYKAGSQAMEFETKGLVWPPKG